MRAAGVAFDVVPGITSAFAAPAAAGVPVTQRGMSASVTVVTGHRRFGDEDETDWDALARVGGTIVVLMGVAERAAIAQRLIDGGLAPETPVTAVRFGTRPDQEVARTTLGAGRHADRSAGRDRDRRRRRPRPHEITLCGPRNATADLSTVGSWQPNQSSTGRRITTSSIRDTSPTRRKCGTSSAAAAPSPTPIDGVAHGSRRVRGCGGDRVRRRALLIARDHGGAPRLPVDSAAAEIKAPPISSDPPEHLWACPADPPRVSPKAVAKYEPYTRCLASSLIDGFGGSAVPTRRRDTRADPRAGHRTDVGHRRIDVRSVHDLGARRARARAARPRAAPEVARRAHRLLRCGARGPQGASPRRPHQRAARGGGRRRARDRHAHPRHAGPLSSPASTAPGRAPACRRGTSRRTQRTASDWWREPYLIPTAIEELLRGGTRRSRWHGSSTTTPRSTARACTLAIASCSTSRPRTVIPMRSPTWTPCRSIVPCRPWPSVSASTGARGLEPRSNGAACSARRVADPHPGLPTRGTVPGHVGGRTSTRSPSAAVVFPS